MLIFGRLLLDKRVLSGFRFFFQHVESFFQAFLAIFEFLLLRQFRVPKDVQDTIMARREEIRTGAWDVFTGPIKDQKGAVKVPEGVKLTDGEMLSMDWFVEGVEGSVK